MLDDFRKTIAADIKTVLPDLRECKPHAGRFDLSEIKRLSARTPGVFISVLGIVSSEEIGTGETDLELAMASYVLTADTRGLPRDVAAVNLVEALSLRIIGSRWGISGGVHPAGKVKANNLYSGDLDRIGIAMWGISWRQKVRLGENLWADEGSVPTELYVGIAPEIGLEHEDDYTLVGSEA